MGIDFAPEAATRFQELGAEERWTVLARLKELADEHGPADGVLVFGSVVVRYHRDSSCFRVEGVSRNLAWGGR